MAPHCPEHENRKGLGHRPARCRVRSPEGLGLASAPAQPAGPHSLDGSSLFPLVTWEPHHGKAARWGPSTVKVTPSPLGPAGRWTRRQTVLAVQRAGLSQSCSELFPSLAASAGDGVCDAAGPLGSPARALQLEGAVLPAVCPHMGEATLRAVLFPLPALSPHKEAQQHPAWPRCGLQRDAWPRPGLHRGLRGTGF